MRSNHECARARFSPALLSASALALVSALATISSTAFAQSSGPAAPEAAEETTTNDEIIVTARRREESLQDVPIAVTAFSTETLREKSINTQDDLVAHTPACKSVRMARSVRMAGSSCAAKVLPLAHSPA